MTTPGRSGVRYSDQVIAIIPARSGSKSLPHKNIRDFGGRPLLAHSIEQALSCDRVSRTIVSTDSAMYAEIATQHGAEAPFLRPADISGDSATDLELFQHALGWLLETESVAPELCVHLRPTHPNRTPAQIAQAVDLLRNHPEWDSVRSVVPAPDPPHKMWFLEPDGGLTPVVMSDVPEAHSMPRQALPQAYLQNASIDVIRSRTILEMHSIAGARVGAMLMEEIHDIDTMQQLLAAEAMFLWKDGVPVDKTFVFDIDGVIASLVPDNDYTRARPLEQNIRRINRLYAAGNRIVLNTARGTMTGIDWREVTVGQLAAWGVKYHEFHLGKPAGDFYVDDRNLTLQTLAMLDTID